LKTVVDEKSIDQWRWYSFGSNDLSNLRPQCYACNVHRSGNWPSFEHHLNSAGIDVDELKRRNEQTKGMKADNLWHMAKIVEYKELLCQPEEIQYT
jgi:hypothetical protein